MATQTTRTLVSIAALTVALAMQACDGPTGPKSGSLSVNIPDLPAGVAAAVTVTGPNNSSFAVTATQTLDNLVPGTYQITAAKVVGEKSTFVPTTAAQTVEVQAGPTPATVTVGYSVTTATVAITITGLPAGSTASIILFTTAGFSRLVTSNTEVGNLEPGTYSLQVADVIADEIYAVPAPQPFTLVASTTPTPVLVAYSAVTGTIRLSANDLPSGIAAQWAISGPNGFSRTITGTGPQSVSRLEPGRYNVTVPTIYHQGEVYVSTPTTISATVSAAQSTPLAFTYAMGATTLNMQIDGAYLTQSTQRYDGSVPLIAGREAYLRVFVRANEVASASPKVRVRIYRGTALVSTTTIDPPRAGVVQNVSQATVADSWGLIVPGSVIVPGTSFLVDVDPDNTVRELNESDNQFPASGTPRAMEVRDAPPLEIRFVPIATAANGLVGDATPARINNLLDQTLRMFPISTYSADVRATFTTNAPLLIPSDSNRAWIQILSELEALRVAEGSLRHYAGVLKRPYASGIAGYGYLSGQTTVSFDAPGGASSVIAHELGHNWSRRHAPCGGPSGIDPQYPYPDASVGTYGFDLVSRTVVDVGAKDLMSYCDPEWISDYTYEAVMRYRAAASGGSSPLLSSPQTSLVVWGRIESGRLVLEPAFVTETASQLPSRSGRYRIEGLDESGAQVFSLSFEPLEVADATLGDARQFAFAVPITQVNVARLASLRLSGNGREVRTIATGVSSDAFALGDIKASTMGSGYIRLQWDAAEHPMLVVRDRETREILAFARGGSARVRTRRTSLDIIASDRVHSRRIQVEVQQ